MGVIRVQFPAARKNLVGVVGVQFPASRKQKGPALIESSPEISLVGAQVLGKQPSNHFRLPFNSFVRRLQRAGPISIYATKVGMSIVYVKRFLLIKQIYCFTHLHRDHPRNNLKE